MDNIEDIYYNKYLKYKYLYLELKGNGFFFKSKEEEKEEELYGKELLLTINNYTNTAKYMMKTKIELASIISFQYGIESLLNQIIVIPRLKNIYKIKEVIENIYNNKLSVPERLTLYIK